MRKSTKEELIADAVEWLNRIHIGRTNEEKQAYMEALDSARIDAEAYQAIYELFFYGSK
jgi:hypothetical protein